MFSRAPKPSLRTFYRRDERFAIKWNKGTELSSMMGNEISKCNQIKLSFPNTGGTAVSSDTLSTCFHRYIFRRTGSEKEYLILMWVELYHLFHITSNLYSFINIIPFLINTSRYLDGKESFC